MTDNEKAVEKIKLRDRLEQMEGFWQYLIVDHPLVEANPNLQSKANQIGDQLLDLKNHIY